MKTNEPTESSGPAIAGAFGEMTPENSTPRVPRFSDYRCLHPDTPGEEEEEPRSRTEQSSQLHPVGRAIETTLAIAHRRPPLRSGGGSSQAEASVRKRAFIRDSCAAADAPQSPERRASHADHAEASQNSKNSRLRLNKFCDLYHEALAPLEVENGELADPEAEPPTLTIPPDEPTDICLFDGRSEEGAADTAAKVNTWRNIPKRARPKIADMIIEIADRATSGDPCPLTNCTGCAACARRDRAWQDFF